MASTRTGKRSVPTRPTYVRALREAGYHTALLGKAHLYLDENLAARHIDDLAWRLEALGFSEVLETGDKFVSKIPSRYTDSLSDRGLLEAYTDAHQGAQLSGRERGRSKRHQERPDVGFDAHAHTPGLVRRHLARGPSRPVDRALRTT